MAFGIDDAVAAVSGVVGKVIDRAWPDPAQAAAAKLALATLEQTGELARLTADTELMKAQAATNTAEASNASVFVAGWRPFMGWVCGFSVAYHFIVERLLLGTLDAFGVTVPDLPQFDTGQLMLLVTGMLGLGVMRSYDKQAGTTDAGPGH